MKRNRVGCSRSRGLRALVVSLLVIGTVCLGESSSWAKLQRVPHVRYERPLVMGSLSRAMIQRVMRQHKGQVSACYKRALRKHPKASGYLNLKWIISSRGKVLRVLILKDRVKVKSLAACVRRVISRMLFPYPRGGGIVLVRTRIHFRLKWVRRFKSRAKHKVTGVKRRNKRGGVGISGSLTKVQIQSTIRKNARRLGSCYHLVLYPGMAPLGKVLMSWTIQPDGSTKEVRVVKCRVRSKRFRRCLTKVVGRFVFPPPKGGGIVKVRYPFLFRPAP